MIRTAINTIYAIAYHSLVLIWKHFYQHAYEQKFDGDKNNPRISSAAVTNFQLTLASAKENFPILNELLGPVEPEMLTFFLAPIFFQEINMVLSDRSQQQKLATN